MTPTIDWVKRYDKLRETDNMIDSINKLVEEVAASLNRQGCRWVKASERNPDKEGLYFVKMADGEKDVNRYAEFYTGDGIEWLDETVLYWLDESIEPCATSSENYWKQRCEAAEALNQHMAYDSVNPCNDYNEFDKAYENWEKIKSQTPSPTGDRDCEELKEELLIVKGMNENYQQLKEQANRISELEKEIEGIMSKVNDIIDYTDSIPREMATKVYNSLKQLLNKHP